jgi:MoxR-like ATPase
MSNSIPNNVSDNASANVLAGAASSIASGIDSSAAAGANQRSDELRAKCLEVVNQFGKYCIGLSHVGAYMMSSALQGGICHILALGVPGTAKTRSVEVFGRLIGGKFAIVQFTSDIMPKDIVGSAYYDKQIDPATGQVIGKWKPAFGELAFANITLGDEINRGGTHAQSAMLAPMSEGRVKLPGASLTAEESTRMLPEVNVFMCTMNPIDQEGTNPLPEAQHDRFLYQVVYDYLSRAFELELMKHPELARREILEKITSVITIDEILETRKIVRANMRMSDSFYEYAASVLRATRPGQPEFNDLYKKNPAIRPILDAIKSGVSPRANMALLEACRVRAFLYGKNEDRVSPRDFVMPEDLKALAHAVFRHRIIMKDEAALRVVKGDRDATSVQYPSDGAITKAQVLARLNAPGKNPITADHVVDAILTHMDHTTDWKKYHG